MVLNENKGTYWLCACKQYMHDIPNTHVVINTTHETFKFDVPRDMLTHTQTHKQTNVKPIATARRESDM